MFPTNLAHKTLREQPSRNPHRPRVSTRTCPRPAHAQATPCRGCGGASWRGPSIGSGGRSSRATLTCRGPQPSRPRIRAARDGRGLGETASQRHTQQQFCQLT